MSEELSTPIEKIQLNYKSNIWPHSEPQGSISRPFILPKENAESFEYINRVNKLNTSKVEIASKVVSKGLVLKEGLLKVNGITKKGDLDCDFLFDTGSFWYLAKQKYLTDIVWEKKVTDWIATMNYTKDHFYPDIEYAFFPIYSPNWGDGYKEEWSNIPGLSLITNNYNSNIDSYDWGAFASIYELARCPYFYLVFVIDKAFEELGYTIISNEIKDDVNLSRLVLYNRRMYRKREGEYPDFYDPISFKNDAPKVLISDFINELRKRGFIFDIDETTKSVRVKILENILDRKNINDISDKASKEKEITFLNNSGIEFKYPKPEIYEITDDSEADIVPANTTRISYVSGKTKYQLSESTTGAIFITGFNNITDNEIGLELTVLGYAKSAFIHIFPKIQQGFDFVLIKNSPWYGNESAKITFKVEKTGSGTYQFREVLGSRVDFEIKTDYNLSGIVNDRLNLPVTPIDGEYYLVEGENNVYKGVLDDYDPAFPVYWEYYTKHFLDYVEGTEPDITIDSEIGTLVNINLDNDYYKLIPHDAVDKSELLANLENEETNNKIELLFYHGLVEYRENLFYPFASHGAYYINKDNLYVVPPGFNIYYSLIWDRFVDTFLRKYVDIMLSLNLLSVERLMDFTVEDLKHMDLYEKKRINNPNDAETAEYIIEEMEVAVDLYGVSATKITMLKID